MKIKTQFLIIIGILLLFYSCDCQIRVNGKIVSAESGKPISNANIELVGRNISSKSDENGVFQIGEMTGFCYVQTIKVAYEGHKPFFVELESDSDFENFKLTKESKFVKYKEPF